MLTAGEKSLAVNLRIDKSIKICIKNLNMKPFAQNKSLIEIVISIFQNSKSDKSRYWAEQKLLAAGILRKK